jgi:hypothetical protein
MARISEKKAAQIPVRKRTAGKALLERLSSVAEAIAVRLSWIGSLTVYYCRSISGIAIRELPMNIGRFSDMLCDLGKNAVGRS